MDKNTRFLDIKGNLILAKDLFKTKKIVLRYSESNCEDCISSEINTILNNNNELKERIILIAYYKNKRDLFVYHKEFKKKGLDNIEMYLLTENGLNVSIEKLNMPFYFV
ncbi:hypothetical protein [Flavivirga rizhaonensis]|uniref:Redoxin domain-containing protein n=1 Tax=Flavivirga rizhaonensis TaxID=2559571 RepID=A0A4S1E0L7_9FLAO|nr:hypothetical protein [Flavivirga rizhaonensis]TGV03448.1 hypothetical protein EM932_07180 [Flavivirga rizhaonensis]